MMSNIRSAVVVLLLVIIVAGSALYLPVYGSDERKEEKNPPPEYPKKMKNRGTFEWLVAAPGLLLNLPFKALFKGIGNTAGYIEDTKLPDRVDDLLTSEDGSRGVRPNYSSRGGAGLKYFHKNLIRPGVKMEIAAAAGLKSRQRYQFTFERLSFLGNKVFTSFDAGYWKQSDERFFGFGPATSPDDESNYTHELTFAAADLGAKFSEDIDLFSSFGFENSTILGGENDDIPSLTDKYSAAALPGLENRIRLIYAGLTLHFDSRNKPTGNATGMESTISGRLYKQPGGGDYAFLKCAADFKLHVHLFYGRTVTFRAAAELTEPYSGRNVPFFKLSELGKQETIRGFERGRYRELDMLLGSIEYNYPIWRKHDGVLASILFVDAGQVANDMLEDSKWTQVQVSFGGGISYKNAEGEILRLLLGKNKEQFRLYAVLN